MRTVVPRRKRARLKKKGTVQPVPSKVTLDPALESALEQFAEDLWVVENASMAEGGALVERARLGALPSTRFEGANPKPPPEDEPDDRWTDLRDRYAERRAEIEQQARQARATLTQGNLTALFDALLYGNYRDGCLFGVHGLHKNHWVGIPRWAIEGLMALVLFSFPRVPVAGSGPHAKWIARWRQDQIDHIRWRVVKALREQKVRFTDGAVYKQAATELARHKLGTSADTVKRSYLAVQKRIKSEPERYRAAEYIGIVIRPDQRT